MLLTGSQISIAISSSVVFTFTTLLFLSGYILQQQTVRSLQLALRPPLSPVPTTNPVLAKHFGQPPGFYDKFLSSNRPHGGWAKVAYVQLVRRHVEVCAAVMGMRELNVAESMAQRIIMYPAAWDKDEGKERARTGEVETSRRLLRKISKEGKVMLQPLERIPQTQEGVEALTEEEKYPLLNVLSLMNYNRLLVLRQPGLILDPTPLDLLFTLPLTHPTLGLSDPQDLEKQPLILLLEPSKDLYRDLAATLPEGAYLDSEFLSKIPTSPAPEDPERRVHLLAATALLANEKTADAFNASEFLDMTAYVQVRDPGLPGPEYDIPRRDYVKAMPGGKEARRAWERVYERFRDARMDVCGLDLEPTQARRDG